VTFQLTILGSSSALPTSSRFPTAHLVNHDERFFLIDCGEGAQMQLRRYKKSFARISHIFISHLHGDHVFGLFGLLSTLSLLGRRADLHLYAHAPLENILLEHLSFFNQEMSYSIRFHAIPPKEVSVLFEDKKIEVVAFPLKHRISCSGFLFREKPRLRSLNKQAIEKYQIPVYLRQSIKMGAHLELPDGQLIDNSELTTPAAKPRSYAFCTDTRFRPALASILKEVDVLYHEATFAKIETVLARNTYHSTTHQAAQVALDSGVKKLIIGHFSSRYPDVTQLLAEAKEIFPECSLANDGDTFNIG